ncbi:MAG: cytochrome c [Marinoscillum sp.]
MRNFSLLVFITLASACGGSENGKGQKTDHRTEIKLKQYIVQGKQLYNTYCSNCHQADGSGLAQLYPPLANSDYLLENLPRAACTIKNGMNGEITVNGVKFNQMMPANKNLSPLEIAEILTYITNSWGNDAGLSDVQIMNRWLSKCEEE